MAEQVKEAAKAPKRQLGPQVMKDSDIPDGIKAAAIAKMGEGASLAPARADGGYKGKVLYANDRYLVQNVGAGDKSAVVHRRADLEVVGNKLGWRAENNKLAGTDVQIHYTGDKAKAYVWNREREAAMKAERAQAKESGQSKDAAPTKEKPAPAAKLDKDAVKAPDAAIRAPRAKAAKSAEQQPEKAAGEPKARAPRAARVPAARQRAAAQEQAAAGPER